MPALRREARWREIFRLRLVEDLDEVADAELLIAHEVEKTEPGFVSERLVEADHIEVCVVGHGANIFDLTDMFQRSYI